MKKNSIAPKSSKSRKEGLRHTIGMDLGDKTSRYCVLDGEGQVVEESSVNTTRKGITQAFATRKRCRIALEVGTHSPWISRLLQSFGYEVVVANARQVKVISQSSRKSDRMDAQMLARLARLDPELLRPIRHRSERAQGHLRSIRIRAALVEARTKLVNASRGQTKAAGERLPECEANRMGVDQTKSLPKELQDDLKPLMQVIATLTEEIEKLDQKVEQIAGTEYPETKLLRQVHGVGPLIALTFVLTIEDKERFQRSRDVGCYIGLRPKQSDSGEKEPQLRITKEGDLYLRKLLVQGAHSVLRRKAPDTDLKRWGLELGKRGGKNAKKRAVVAVARKLAILLHRLWVTGEVYEPLRNSQAAASPPKKTRKAA